MREDAELLRRYVEFHSEADFTELVQRHLGFVYHAALRRTSGRADLAEEVSQYVFSTLACKARELARHPVLVGWLHTTTRHAANTCLRSERRRLARELEAQRMSDLGASDPEPEWQRLRQELDGVLDQLPERDREAILLRFFQDRPFAQVGTAFALSEDAARKRVDRALDRLRELLAKRGVTSTSVALATLLSAQAASAAPVGLTQSVATAALAHAAGVGVPAAGLVPLMGTKTTLGIAGLLGLAGLITIPTVGVAIYAIREARQAEVAVTEAQREQAVLAKKLQATQKTVAETDRRAAEIQAGVEQARAALAAAPAATQPAAAAPAAAKPKDPARIDGDNFLASFPEAKRMLLELGRAQIGRNYAGFYQFAQLTPTQIEAWEHRVADYQLENVALTPRSIVPAVGRLPDEQIVEILGPEGLAQFKEYSRVKIGYEFAEQVNFAVGYLGTPLTAEQSSQLVQAVLNNSSSYRAGGRVDADSVDAAAAYAQVKAALTPAQWEAAQPLLLNLQFKQAITRAHQQSLAAGGEKPKP